MPKKGVTPPHLRKYLFRKGGRKRTRRTKVRTMARRPRRSGGRRYDRRRRRGGGSRKLPILSIGILVGQAMVANATGGSTEAKVSNFLSYYTGYSFITKQFSWQNLAFGYGPWIAKRYIGKIAGVRAPRGLPISLS